jgi:hypothetical protein
MSDDLYCDQCDLQVTRENATRTETMGDLDSETWQTLCCPSCGRRLKTVFVADEA